MDDGSRRVTDSMSGSDALLWTIGRDPVLRPTIVAVLVLDGAPGWADVQRRVEALVEAVPRFRSRAGPRPFGRGRRPFVMDRHFDLAFHLRRLQLPAGATFRDVLDLAQVMAAIGFDAELPPWEAVVVEGVDGQQAAVVIKLHHALVDGVGGVAVLMHLLDEVRHPPDDRVPPPEPTTKEASRAGLHRLPAPRRVIEAVVHSIGHPLEPVQQIVATAASTARLLAPASRPLSPLMTERGFKRDFEVLTVEAQALREAAAGVGGTINDVFVAAVIRGLTLYHGRHGVTIKGLRALMPINVRATGAPVGGNHFVPVRFIVPAPEDSLSCVREVQRITASWKHAPGLALNDVLASGLDKLPDPVVTAMWGSMLKGDDFCVTNVPGPTCETYFAGSQVLGMYAFAPP